jgi:hypothetical protein
MGRCQAIGLAAKSILPEHWRRRTRQRRLRGCHRLVTAPQFGVGARQAGRRRTLERGVNLRLVAHQFLGRSLVSRPVEQRGGLRGRQGAEGDTVVHLSGGQKAPQQKVFFFGDRGGYTDTAQAIGRSDPEARHGTCPIGAIACSHRTRRAAGSARAVGRRPSRAGTTGRTGPGRACACAWAWACARAWVDTRNAHSSGATDTDTDAHADARRCHAGGDTRASANTKTAGANRCSRADAGSSTDTDARTRHAGGHACAGAHTKAAGANRYSCTASSSSTDTDARTRHASCDARADASTKTGRANCCSTTDAGSSTDTDTRTRHAGSDARANASTKTGRANRHSCPDTGSGTGT